MTISATVDAAKEIPCCSRTLTDTNQIAASANPVAPATDIVTVLSNTDGPIVSQSPPSTDIATKSNGHKSISTTENNTHNTDASESISRVSSSNSVQNQNRKSSINLEPGFIETIMDDYIRKTN